MCSRRYGHECFYCEPARGFYMPGYCAKKYGLFNFLVDVTLTCITVGFWLIWIFVREMRKR